MRITGQNIIASTPLIFTVLLIVWTLAVAPFTKYGDWRIYPALFLAPMVLIVHILLIASRKGARLGFLFYAIMHGTIFFVIWTGCLMWISKDFL
jgi:predicted ferric reductase